MIEFQPRSKTYSLRNIAYREIYERKQKFI